MNIDNSRATFAGRLVQAALSVKLAHHEMIRSNGNENLMPLVELLEDELQRLINNETQCFDPLGNPPTIAQLILLMFNEVTTLPR